jgi:hypothetical protein
MGFSLFDKANLAVIAYASVKADGTIIAASNLEMVGFGTGNYSLIVPPNLNGVREPLFSPTDINIVTVMGSIFSIPNITSMVANQDEYVKSVNFRDAQTNLGISTDFTIVVLRTLIKTP